MDAMARTALLEQDAVLVFMDNLCRVGNVQHVRDRQVSLVSPEGIGLMR